MSNPKSILFLCPHGAAKSVLAMVYFKDLAEKAGLHVLVSNAGTEPDPVINPKVDAFLKTEGFDLSPFVPPLLEQEDLQMADIVVSIGCIDASAVPDGIRYLDWSAVPMLSDDFQSCRDMIYGNAVLLVQTLAGEEMAGS